MIELDAPNWIYCAEGAQHALFAPRSGSDYVGRLLRLLKTDLARSALEDGGDAEEGGEDGTEIDLSSLNNYVSDIVYPLFRDCIDLPESVSLPKSFLRKLRTIAIESEKIPAKRRKDWEPFLALGQGRGSLVVSAQLVVDYRLPPVMADDMTTWIAVELKPKAGYLAFSPLVNARRRRKYTTCRYQLLQETKNNPIRSAYNPLDLFSVETDRIQDALRAMMRTPKNNFRIWKNGRLQSNEHQVSVDDATQERIARRLTSILSEHPLLPTLMRLQKLDVLDADGVLLVYESLLPSFPTREELERRIDYVIPSSSAAQPHLLFHGSPIAAPLPISSEFTQLCDHIVDFSETVDAASPDIPDKAELDAALERGMKLATRCKVEERIFLIQNWMLSLVMCDVSVFVGFPIGGGGCRVRLVDYQRKPASKLRTRAQKEELLNK